MSLFLRDFDYFFLGFLSRNPNNRDLTAGLGAGGLVFTFLTIVFLLVVAVSSCPFSGAGLGAGRRRSGRTRT